jgi:protein-disulfide isomerase
MSKREELRAKRRQKQQRQRIIIIIVIAVLVIVTAGIIIISSNPAIVSGPVAPVTPVAANPRPQANGLSMGDPNAPIKVVEYADFQCPGCKKFFENNEPIIVTNYVATGKVFYTYFPFSFIDEIPGAKGNESKHAAEAAYCASEQNKFWEYHDILFTNQGAENSGNFNDQRLSAFAVSLGLDMTKFNACYKSGKYQQKVLDDEIASNQAGINETPSFIVNGVLTPSDKLIETIDADLKAAGK